MVFACGVGAFGIAVFHLLAHGFLKGFLFLSTGDALLATGSHSHGTSEVRGRRLRSLALGALLLACVPPFVLFSGPYELIWSAQQVLSARVAFWVVGLATVFLTALYAFRGVVSLFGESVGRSVSARPQLLSMAHVPGLAAMVALAGVFLVALWSQFSDFLGPALGAGPPSGPTFGPALAAALAAAVAGWGFAYYRYLNPSSVPVTRREWGKTAYVLLLNKLYFDEIHRAVAVQPTLRFSRWLWRELDLRLIDRLVHGAARLVQLLAGWLDRFAETILIERAVHGVGSSARVWAVWLERTAETRAIERAPHIAASGLVHASGWLWRIIDRRGTDMALQQVGRLADETGGTLQRIGPRTLRHHLVIIVCWLALAIGFTYWLII